jgi:hypothetical protein
MSHRFTEPTPASFADRVHVQVFVSSWEIECCAPPPVIGEQTTWTLQFVSASGPYAMPDLQTERAWQVAQRGDRTFLTNGPINVFWSDFDGAPPTPGRAMLRGHVYGNAHAQSAEIPAVTGIVQRIRIASQVFAPHGERELRAVPGTLTLTDVNRSPRWFSNGERPLTDRVEQAHQIGVLLDLAVPPAAPSST